MVFWGVCVGSWVMIGFEVFFCVRFILFLVFFSLGWVFLRVWVWGSLWRVFI